MGAIERPLRLILVGLLVLAGSHFSTGAASAASASRTLVLGYWVMPTTLNPHHAPPGRSSPSTNAARLVLQPLASIDGAGELVPALAAFIPTLANGGIAADLRSVTWRLKDRVRWSDGTPLTAADVVFTFEYMRDPAVGATTADRTTGIESVVAVDDLTVLVTFTGVTPHPYRFGVGSGGMILQRAQFEPYKGPAAADAPVNLAPIGTGPYTVTSFGPERLAFRLNHRARLAPPPYFRDIEIVATSGALASAEGVLRDGTIDYGWNLNLPLDQLRSLVALDRGDLVSTPGAAVERVVFNLADPAQDSEPGTAHPFFSDLRVRTAFAMAVDRSAIAALFGPGVLGDATCDLVTGIAAYASPNTAGMDVCRHDVAAANALLDQAGWGSRGGDGVRTKDGVRLSVLFQTTIHPIRAREQAILAAGWERIGAEVRLKAVSAFEFFSQPQSPNSAARFLADLEMFTNTLDWFDPTSYLSWWRTDNTASSSNAWTRMNWGRFSDPAFEALFEALRTTADPAARAELIIAMNDLLVGQAIEIPLFDRRLLVSGVVRSLQGLQPTPWDDATWNVAEWYRARSH